MKQTFNPEYGALLNSQRGDFSIVTHVPVLPPASKEFKSILCYLKADGCFYRCIQIDNIWTWDKVTYGPFRQYVLPVCWITVEYVFDDEVNAIKAIICGLKRYGDYFADMEEGPNGVSLLTAVRKVNEIIKYVNRVCGVELEYVDEGVELDAESGDTCEELGTKLNLLIGVLNPHAGAKLEHDKLLARIEALEQQAGTRETYRLITADERADGVTEDEIYFIKNDEGEYIQTSIDEFEDGVDYYVSDMTSKELAARLTTAELNISRVQQSVADLGVLFRQLKGGVDTVVADNAALKGRVDSIETTVTTIIGSYIGWNKRGASDLTVMERLIALEGKSTTSAADVASLAASVEAMNTSIAGIQTNITAILAAQKQKDEAQDTERAELVASNAKYKAAFQTIAGIEVSDDMSFSEVHAAVNAIIAAAKTVIA